MVDAHTLRERARAPTLHPRHQHRNDINAAALEWTIATDLLVARATKQLAGAGHMVRAAERIIIGDAVFTERAASQAELRVGGKLSEQVLKVIRNEREIGVEAADDVEGKTLDDVETGIERCARLAAAGRPQLSTDAALRRLWQSPRCDPLTRR